MKNKLVIMSLLLAGAVTVATAQTKEKFYSERFLDNTFVSAGVGGQVCVNPDNSDYGLGKAITPLIHISVGKLFTPVWGVRGQVAGFWTKLYSKYGTPAGKYNKVEKNYGTIRFDGLFNLSNAIGGYNPDRLFTVSVFAGPGLTFAKTYGNLDKVNALVNGSVGVMGQFNVAKNWDVNVEARGEVSPSVFGSRSSAYTDGAVSLTAGVTYTFGGKKFISCGASNAVAEKVINDNVNKYREELEQAQQELVQTKNALANVKPEVREVVKENVIVNPIAVFFKIGSSKIDEYGMVNIKLLAKAMKANPKAKYKIAGYADQATGSSATNQRISEARAKAVYDALIAEGVNKDQLEYVGFGGTKDMFGKVYLNRVVILE